MKRILSLLAIATFASCSIFAQDDMYFTPKSKAVKEKEKAEAKAAEEKKRAEEEARVLEAKKEWLRKNRQHLSETEDGKLVYHVGRDVSADEYNRRGKFASSYAIVSDSTASDIIDFTPGDGQYPDSLIASIDTLSGSISKKSTDRYDDDDDYYYSRRMNRFDDFYGSRRMWLLYNDPWYSHWAYDPFFWNDPWYWNSSWVYSPWYWNDPWYYGYYGYYGRYYGGYYGGYYGWTSYYPHHHYHYTPVIIDRGGRNSGHQRTVRVSKGSSSPRGYREVTSNIKTQDRKASPRYNSGFSGSRGGNRNTYSSNNSGYSSRSSNSSSYSNNSSSSNYSSRSSSSSSSSSRGSSSGGYSSSSRSSGSSSGGGGFRGRR